MYFNTLCHNILLFIDIPIQFVYIRFQVFVQCKNQKCTDSTQKCTKRRKSRSNFRPAFKNVISN